MKKFLNTIKISLDNVYLVDKVLMLYMIILLVYTAFHIFSNSNMQESNTADIVIRTAASAIFGYFISNNFVKSDNETESKIPSPTNTDNYLIDENSINQGFQASSNTDNAEIRNIDTKDVAVDSSICCNSLQIIIVSGIGLISLILLLISRNISQITPEFSATVSQLRDFLSACIGFLVSCGKAK